MNKEDLKIVFMGTPEFAATCLSKLVGDGYKVVMAVTQPDKPVGRKHIITPPPAKVKAEELGIEVFQPDSMRTDETFERLSSVAPDLIVTAAYGKILPERVLKLPRYECINVHASLLPKYRGAAPVQYSILNGDKVTGVTIMKMDVGMDTGDILTADEIEIDRNIHTDELMAALADLGSDLLLKTIPDYIDGKITPVKQNEEEATACPPIKPEQAFFTWNESAFSIHNKVRALSAWPGAYTMVADKKFKIYGSLALESVPEAESLEDVRPGMVVKAHKSDLIVATGEGFLKILELQTEGGKRLEAVNCAHNYKVGTVL